MTRRVLLVIDMLNDFLDPAGALYCGEEARKIIPVIRSLIDAVYRRGRTGHFSEGRPRSERQGIRTLSAARDKGELGV